MTELHVSAEGINPPDPHPAESAHILEGFHLVEADAGTGKTWTLATLVVRAIREGRRQLGDILVVTFTKAATAELSDRIRQFLQAAFDDSSSKAAADPAHRVERERLRLALAQIDSLTVKTIHGYCQSVLRDNSFALDLPGDLVVNEARSDELGEVLAQWWRDKVLVNGLALDATTWRTLFSAGLSLKSVQTMIRQMAADPELIIWPGARDYGLMFSGHDAEGDTALAQHWMQGVARADEAARRVHQLLSQHGVDVTAWLLGPAKKLARAGSRFGSSYQANHVPGRVAKILACHNAADFLDAGVDAPLKSLSTSTLVNFMAESDLLHVAVFEACETLLAELKSLAAVNALLAQVLGKGILNRLHENRRARGESGYDGLLQEVYLLVSRHPEAAAMLRARHPMAMIDESQDTDPLQWAIFDSIYEPGREPDVARPGPSARDYNLIMVGDPKQAIYGFRGADVFTYLRAGERVDGRHQLSVNRRSSPLIIEAINRCFDESRTGKPVFLQDDIPFRPALAHTEPGELTGASACRMVHLGDGEPEALKQLAARLCVEEIEAMRKAGTARQYCVLVREHAQAVWIEEALEQRGIACVRNSRDTIWQSRWADELQLVLRALAQPGDMTALRQAAMTEALTLNAVNQGAAAGAFEFLQVRILQARHAWFQKGSQAALAGLLLGPALSLKSHGAYQQLIELLSLDVNARASPLQAMHWLERVRERSEGNGGNAPWRVLDPDAVQVMTIHNSKGLEFEAVFLPFAWLSGLRKAKNLDVTKHHRWIEREWRGVIDTTVEPESKTQIAREKLAEELRLFYVAMTRAARHLVLFSPETPAKDSPVEYYSLHTLEDLSGVPDLSAPRSLAPPEKTADWQLAPPQRDYAASWHWQSYTALTRHSAVEGEVRAALAPAQAEASAADHEQAIDGEAMLEDPLAGKKLAMRFRFPRGAKAGVILHKVFERHPFTQAMGAVALRQCFEGAGMPGLMDELDEVNAWAEDILCTPIDLMGGARLRDLKAAQRKTELGFTLEMNQFNWSQALALVDRHYPVSAHSKSLIRPDLFSSSHPSSHHERLNGFLIGFIDLIFEWQGRYYILDWKSNFLGSKTSDYKQAAMETAIAEHDYAMQWCLYQVALLRWLRMRLPGQDPLPLMGGVVYAFLRGMAGEDAAATSAAPGVYSTRVPDELVMALDQCLGAQ